MSSTLSWIPQLGGASQGTHSAGGGLAAGHQVVTGAPVALLLGRPGERVRVDQRFEAEPSASPLVFQELPVLVPLPLQDSQQAEDFLALMLPEAGQEPLLP